MRIRSAALVATLFLVSLPVTADPISEGGKCLSYELDVYISRAEIPTDAINVGDDDYLGQRVFYWIEQDVITNDEVDHVFRGEPYSAGYLGEHVFSSCSLQYLLEDLIVLAECLATSGPECIVP